MADASLQLFSMARFLSTGDQSCKPSGVRRNQKKVTPHRDRIDGMLDELVDSGLKVDLPAFSISARLFRLGRLIEPFFAGAFEQLDVPFADGFAMLMLYQAGPKRSLTPARIGEVLLRSSGGVTATIDRLEEGGFVERKLSPNDRRSILVQLTPEGIQMAERLWTAVSQSQTQLLAPLDPDEQEAATRVLRTLLSCFEQWLEKPAGAATSNDADRSDQSRR